MEDSNKIHRSNCGLQNSRPHNYLLMTLDGKIFKGIFEHERLKPAVLRTNHGNVQNLAELRQIMNTNLRFS